MSTSEAARKRAPEETINKESVPSILATDSAKKDSEANKKPRTTESEVSPCYKPVSPCSMPASPSYKPAEASKSDAQSCEKTTEAEKPTTPIKPSFTFGDGTKPLDFGNLSSLQPNPSGFVFPNMPPFGSLATPSASAFPSIPPPNFGLPAGGSSLFSLPPGGQPVLPLFTPFSVPASHTGEEEDDVEKEVPISSSDEKSATVLIPKDQLKTGEEGEELVFSAPAKLWRLNTAAWSEKGTGTLRLLRDSDANKFRLLLRAESTLRTLLNMPIFSDMECELASPKSIKVSSLEPGDNGKIGAVLYLLRLDAPDKARDLFASLQNAMTAPPKTPTKPQEKPATTSTSTSTSTCTTPSKPESKTAPAEKEKEKEKEPTPSKPETHPTPQKPTATTTTTTTTPTKPTTTETKPSDPKSSPSKGTPDKKE
ncbi:Ran-binding protein 3 [Pelomyxa schiedti]|nr:Ran-binding protein 3 [Pelomyxa schiedti]